jgi:hypothetical protein
MGNEVKTGLGHKPGVGMSGTVVRGIGRFLALQAVIILLLAVLMTLPASGIEVRPEVIYGNTVYGLDFIDSGMSQVLLHRDTLATTDQEALAISFQDGPGAASVAPAIAQTSSGTVIAASLGFFASNFQFCPSVNLGAPAVGVGQFMAPYPVTTAKFSGHSLMFPEMTVEGNLLANGNVSKMGDTGITLPPSQAYNAYDKVRGLTYLEKNRSAEGFSAREKGLPVILSSATVDLVSTPGQINNTSIVDRLWRNTHQANSLNYLYEGEAAMPVWIAPANNPYELIDCGIASEAIKSSLEMTRPGKFLTRAYWSL